MKLHKLLLALCLLPSMLSAQYGLEVEVVSEDIGVIVGVTGSTDLTGYACYRAYITMANEADFLSSISGDANNPTYVTSSTDNFYHAALGAATPNGINSILFPVYPELPYDSWVTIGLEGVPNAGAGEAAVATVQSSSNPWTTNFDPGLGAAGTNIVIDDAIGGAWYVLNGDANGIAGPDMKVLAGQFTTDGDISMELYTQIFVNGLGTDVYSIDTLGTLPTFVYPSVEDPGCTDATACNYDENAGVDDGSCTYPDEDYLDCNGDCLNDADMDGLCDELETSGCTDMTACNYNESATDDDGSCEFTTCLGCTDSAACNYDMDATEDDGSCDYETCAGCTDELACNYDADAVIDEGCLYPEDVFGSSDVDCDGNCTCGNGGGGATGQSGPFGLVVETYAEDIGMAGTVDLTGYDTYRLYAKLSSPEDFLMAVYGDVDFPTKIQGGDNFFNAEIGGRDNEGYNPALFPLFADLEYDSFISIGMTAPAVSGNGEAPINAVGDPSANWIPEFEPGEGATGSDIIIDTQIGGSWFPLFPDANGFAGSDSLVLIGQFTTDVPLSGEVSFAVFLDGVPSNDTIVTIPIPGQVLEGCTDPLAENFCSCAEENDGSCEYANGCTDEAACNYVEGASIDDGSCIFPEDLWGSALYDCEGNCLGAPPGDGAVSGATPGEYGLQVEVYSSDVGVLVGALGNTDLSGYTTYRAYITVENEEDFLSAISGDIVNPTWVTTTTDFYQAPLGGATPNGINALLFPVYPELEYDSWVTIGLEGAADYGAGEADVTIGQSSGNLWIEAFDPGGGIPGSDIIINDFFGGYWFALNDDANAIAGEDLRVLVGQFTTTGELELGLYTQIFIDGNGLNQLEFDGELPTFIWSSGGGSQLYGCNDEAACNFAECAVEDDGSCVYPEITYLDCEGNCLNDSDGDGICDEDEECTDPAACDYDGSEPLTAPYCLVLDTVTQHSEGELAGMTTYRLSLQCENSTDFVSAVAGYSDFPTRILTTTSFYQSQLGGPTPNAIYPTLVDAFPDLAFDSWITLGLSQAPDIPLGEAEVNTIQNSDYPWITHFEPGMGAPGGSIVMEDEIGGSWFSLIGDANAYADENQQVLLAQLTTDGTLSGELYIQLFSEGNGQNIQYLTLDIGGGCILADEDCSYPVDEFGVGYVDCDGACLHDTDGDGICDEEEVPGCTDESACNFNEEATDDDGGCSYLEVTFEALPVSCYEEGDGSLVVSATGGIAPFGLTISGFPTVSVESLPLTFDTVPPGLYTAELTDAAGCETDFIPFEVVEPEPLFFELDFVMECASPDGEPFYFYVDGGTPPYTLLAEGDTTYAVTTDESNGYPLFLQPGTYTLGVTDASGCTAEGDYVDVEFVVDACLGCTDEGACNYDSVALEEDGSCYYPPSSFTDCDGNCFNDTDGDGVCDEEEIPGCTWPYACNYDPEATAENGTCFIGSVFFDCEGNCQLDLNDNGICDFFEDFTSGTDYCGPGTVWDPEEGACIGVDDCPSDINDDGYIGMGDLLDLLSDFATFCE